MQACRRRGHGTGVPGIDRLVTLPVFRGPAIALNIGWQRNFAQPVQFVPDIRRTGKIQAPMAGIVRFDHCCANGGGGSIGGLANDLRARARAFARPQHRPPVVAPVFFEQQHLKLSAGVRVGPAQPGGNYTGIVEHEHVARAEKSRQIPELAVRPRLPSARCRTSSRDSSRCGAGCCAINSGGRSKLKSAVRTRPVSGFGTQFQAAVL